MMNDGLQFGASPRTHENAKSGGVPLEVRAMARELGIAPEDLCQAEEMWSKLNEISQNDPDSYKKLVQVSAKHVERQGGGVKAKVVDLEKENNPNVEENTEFNEEEERVAEQILEKS